MAMMNFMDLYYNQLLWNSLIEQIHDVRKNETSFEVAVLSLLTYKTEIKLIWANVFYNRVVYYLINSK